MKPLIKLVEDPPKEDSPDLTDDEIEDATDTEGPDDLAQVVVEEIKLSKKFSVGGYELRRRGDDLFLRVRLVCAQEPARVLIYKVSWLGDGYANQV